MHHHITKSPQHPVRVSAIDLECSDHMVGRQRAGAVHLIKREAYGAVIVCIPRLPHLAPHPSCLSVGRPINLVVLALVVAR